MSRKRSLDPKNEKIEIRVTPDQKRALAAAADRAGLPVATWIREFALSHHKKHK